MAMYIVLSFIVLQLFGNKSYSQSAELVIMRGKVLVNIRQT